MFLAAEQSLWTPSATFLLTYSFNGTVLVFFYLLDVANNTVNEHWLKTLLSTHLVKSPELLSHRVVFVRFQPFEAPLTSSRASHPCHYVQSEKTEGKIPST